MGTCPRQGSLHPSPTLWYVIWTFGKENWICGRLCWLLATAQHRGPALAPQRWGPAPRSGPPDSLQLGTSRRTGPGVAVIGILTGSQPAFTLQKPRLNGLELQLRWCQERDDSWVPPSPACGWSGSLWLVCSFTYLQQSFKAGLKV